MVVQIRSVRTTSNCQRREPAVSVDSPTADNTYNGAAKAVQARKGMSKNTSGPLPIITIHHHTSSPHSSANPNRLSAASATNPSTKQMAPVTGNASHSRVSTSKSRAETGGRVESQGSALRRRKSRRDARPRAGCEPSVAGRGDLTVDQATALSSPGTGISRRFTGSTPSPNPSSVNAPSSGSVPESPQTTRVGWVRSSSRTRTQAMG